MIRVAISSAVFRDLFGSFPTPVAVVTTTAADGTPRGFTCNAFSAISADPPLLLVCVDRRSRTLHALRSSKGFAVHVLGDGGQAISELFAERSDHKFAGLAWRPSAVAGGAPVLLEGTRAHAECTVERIVEAGDHSVVIGLVENAEVLARDPLLYQRRSYAVWPGVPTPVR
ncbi:flavin reductase family protein [Umezawaea beigongshangensis]|uniref:flavin reductase family protein n=1 Tax=Umezawaea beigongshangensis TaxID=2780383 RepID=UPI0018F169A4|nr:flavin reductase family protein [Umezawaea beigongshangensis]